MRDLRGVEILTDEDVDLLKNILDDRNFMAFVCVDLYLFSREILLDQNKISSTDVNKEIERLHDVLYRMSINTKIFLDEKLKSRIVVKTIPIVNGEPVENTPMKFHECNFIEELETISSKHYEGHTKREHTRDFIIRKTQNLFSHFNLPMNYETKGPLRKYLEFYLGKAEILHEVELDYDIDELIKHIRKLDKEKH